MFGLIFFIALLIGIFLWKSQGNKEMAARPVPLNLRELLEEHVHFFRSLSDDQKIIFTNRATQLLHSVRIDGVHTEVTDTDRALIAASAVIPIFGFPEWQYRNVTDILLYDDHFNTEYESQGKNNDRNLMGMVGSGTLNDKMLLSKTALRAGFSNKTDKENTAIHEFVHLLDKADGAADGLPEALLGKQYTLPWLNLIHQQMQAIKNNDSDINPYGSTNQAEFFAVASEYFFERPELLQQKHPDLYAMLEKIFHQDPAQH